MANEPIEHRDPGDVRTSTTLPMVVYILYIVAPFVGGLTALIGVIIAYASRRDAEVFLQSHYTNQIYLFWWSLGLVFLSFLLMPIAIGGLLYLAWVVWAIVRSVIGLVDLSNRTSMAMPPSFLTGR